MKIKSSKKTQKITTYILSGLGAAGSALQNYSAVELFLRGIALSFDSLAKVFSGAIQAISIAGGACNGLVNYFINVDLVEDFLHRLTSNKGPLELTGWRKFRYYAGLFVFGTTGILFGMMAFAFSATTPLSILALAAGVFVAIIMTIQELETWLQSFDETVHFLINVPSAEDIDKVISDSEVLIIYRYQSWTIGFCNRQGQYEEQEIKDLELIAMLQEHDTEQGKIETTRHLQKINQLLVSLGSNSQKRSLKDIISAWWSTLTFKKACGHLIALGNVLALSILFTISLVDVLIALQVAALPALVIGLTVAFTFGAFTEFYFYNFFLAKFCNKINVQWENMKSTRYAPLGYASITINALVNAVLTYIGVGLLSGAFLMAGIAAPPVGLMMVLAIVSAVFAGSASFILGMDFWIRKLPPVPVETNVPAVPAHLPPSTSDLQEMSLSEPPFTQGLSFLQNMNPRPKPSLEQGEIQAGISCSPY